MPLSEREWDEINEEHLRAIDEAVKEATEELKSQLDKADKALEVSEHQSALILLNLSHIESVKDCAKYINQTAKEARKDGA